MERPDPVAAGLVVATAEKIQFFRPERVFRAETRDDRFGQHSGSGMVVADHGMSTGAGQVNIDMAKTGRATNLADAIRVRRADDKKLLDRVGDQRLGGPSFFLRIA